MDFPKETAYHIVISSVDGTVLNSSSFRLGIAPEYVQKYVTISKTESEAQTVKDSAKAVSCFQQICEPESERAVSETSFQRSNPAISFKQQYPKKQGPFGSSQITGAEKCIDTGTEDVNDSNKEDTYVLKITGPKRKVLETSFQRCDAASPFVQEYLKTQRSFESPQKSDQWNKEKKSTLIGQVYLRPKSKIESEFSRVKNMTVEQDTWSMNQIPAENSDTEAQNVNYSIEEDNYVLKIIGRDGNVLETSFQRCDRASTFRREYLSKQSCFGSTRKIDELKGEQKVTFRKHVHVRPKSKLKTEYIEINNFTVGQDTWFVNQIPAENSDTENPKQITNNSARKRVVIIWVICLIGFPRMAKANECLESLSTVTLTPSCPTTEKQWTEKALLKKCSSHSQSCSSSSDFVYHCLINAFGNATVEVCAPKIRTSYCVEFNSLGARIQANFHSKCTNTTTNCGKFYNSNEMYKVPQCYSSFNEHSMPYKLSETTIPHHLQTTTNEIETTDSFTTINQTEDSRYADKSSSSADKLWGYATVGIITITTSILLIVLLMILKKKNLKKHTDIEAAKNILRNSYLDQSDRLL